MIPTLRAPDSTLAFLRHGYTFVSRTCDRLGTDGFATRLVGRPVVCLRGADAARFFYSADAFTRAGAIPASVAHLLQDDGSVQSLNGPEHRHRKALFRQVLPTGPDGPMHGALTDDALSAAFEARWHRAVHGWQRAGSVVLHRELPGVLTRAALDWVGTTVTEPRAARLSGQLAAMVERAGSFGPTNWIARARRRDAERWATQLIREVRQGRPGPSGAAVVSDASPVAAVAGYRDPEGRALPPEIAAVELINLLRPVVAVWLFMVFAAHALVRYPQWRERFAGGDEESLPAFVDEVRRFYPFFPAIAGFAGDGRDWQGHRFAAGDWVMLDLYGTNHDPRSFDEPLAFRPERFAGAVELPEALVPQGAGDPATGHRCPGEQATRSLMAQAVRLLTRSVRYRVPSQDLHIDLRRMPARPADGMVIADVRPA
jgi:fatty-acid peroxygenase